MERILERYERYSYAEKQLIATDTESQGSWTLEHAKLKARIDLLEKSQRHFMGEDIDSLTLKELQNLEHQLDSALKHIRSRKSQLMFESISELQKKEKALQGQNKVLSKTIKEKEELTQQADQLEHPNQENLPFPLRTVDVGDAYRGGGDGEVEETLRQNQANTIMPPWMIRHMNE